MRTFWKTAVLSVLVGLGFTLAVCLKNVWSSGDGVYDFGEDIAFIERDAGRKLEEDDYVKRIMEYNSSYQYNPITFYYKLITIKEYWNKYPDSPSANAWHIYSSFIHGTRRFDKSFMKMMTYMQEMPDTPAIPLVMYSMFHHGYVNSHNSVYLSSGNDDWWDVPSQKICESRKEALARLCTYWARRIPDTDGASNAIKGKNAKEWAEKDYSDAECEHLWALFAERLIDNTLKLKKFTFSPHCGFSLDVSIQSLKNERKTAKWSRRSKLDKLINELEERRQYDQEKRMDMDMVKSELYYLAKGKSDYNKIRLAMSNLILHGVPMQERIPNYDRLVKSVGRKEADLLDAYYAVYVSGRAKEIMSKLEKMNQRDERVLMLKYDCQCALFRPLGEIIPTLDAILKLNPNNEPVRKTREIYIEKEKSEDK